MGSQIRELQSNLETNFGEGRDSIQVPVRVRGGEGFSSHVEQVKGPRALAASSPRPRAPARNQKSRWCFDVPYGSKTSPQKTPLCSSPPSNSKID
jgi:hypothetical protein